MKTAFALLALALAGCGAAPATMTLTSPDLAEGAAIARTHYYTRCGGENLAPALSWTGAPANTGSYAVTLVDHSVKPHEWSHWIVLNIPASAHELPSSGALPSGAAGATSDFGDASFDGPCPPAGSGLHHYEFTVWALRGAAPTLPAHANAERITQILNSAAIAKGSINVTAEH